MLVAADYRITTLIEPQRDVIAIFAALFVEKSLLRELHLAPDSVVFDPNIDRHHRLIDSDTGSIHDVPWNRVEVCNIEGIGEYEISDYQVVMHGRKKRESDS